MKIFIIYLILYLVLLFLHLQSFNYIFDDAYIHFRIAENLIDYGSPYYNITEAYMSSSSTAWTIFLSSLYYVFGSFYLNLIQILNPLFLLINLLLYQKIIEQHIQKQINNIQKLILYICYISISLNSSVGLMETQLTLLLTGLALYLFQRNNLFGFVYLSIAVFLRLEIAIFFILYFIYYSSNNHRDIPKIIIISFSSSIIFLVYDFYYFGTLIPLTLIAKSTVYDLSIIDVAQTVIPSIYGSYGKVLEASAILVLIIYAVKCYKYKIKITPVFIFIVGGVTLLLAYIAKRTFIHGWYQPLYLIPIMMLFIIILYQKRSISKFIFILAIFIMLPFINNAFHIAYGSATNEYQSFPYFYAGARVQQYLDISKKLYKKYPEHTLMTSEIGGLGYGFRGKIIDGMGLIQPDCLKYHPMSIPEERTHGGIGAIPSGCVIEKLPELIVSLDVFIQSLRKNEILNQYNHYQIPVFKESDLKLAHKKSIWGSNYLNIYIRKDIDKGI